MKSLEEEYIGTPPVSLSKCKDACRKEGVDWDKLNRYQQFGVADKIHCGFAVKFKKPIPEEYRL